MQHSPMAGRKPFTLQDEPRVLAALTSFPLRDQAAFLLGTNTGFRATELLSLNVCDVAENGRIRVSVTVARRQLKGGRGGRRKGITSRTVPLNEAAAAALQNYLFSRFGSGPAAPQEPLFASRFHGQRLTRWRLNLIVKAVLQKAGVGSPGGLRYPHPPQNLRPADLRRHGPRHQPDPRRHGPRERDDDPKIPLCGRVRGDPRRPGTRPPARSSAATPSGT